MSKLGFYPFPFKVHFFPFLRENMRCSNEFTKQSFSSVGMRTQCETKLMGFREALFHNRQVELQKDRKKEYIKVSQVDFFLLLPFLSAPDINLADIACVFLEEGK